MCSRASDWRHAVAIGQTYNLTTCHIFSSQCGFFSLWCERRLTRTVCESVSRRVTCETAQTSIHVYDHHVLSSIHHSCRHRNTVSLVSPLHFILRQMWILLLHVVVLLCHMLRAGARCAQQMWVIHLLHYQSVWVCYDSKIPKYTANWIRKNKNHASVKFYSEKTHSI